MCFLIALSGKMQKVVKHADLKVQREGSNLCVKVWYLR